MNPLSMSVVYGRAKLDASSSASIFPSATNSRWNLTGGYFAWSAASISSTFQIVEVDSAASTVFFQFNATTTMGFVPFYLGPLGIQASATYSQLKVLSGRSDQVSLTIGFSGFYTGW